MTQPHLIAVDWGTTNRRVFAISANGEVLATEQDECGIRQMTGKSYSAELTGIRARLGDVPVICAGMVGSNRGWIEAQYLRCPANLYDLANALHWIEIGRTAIIPGLSWISDGRGDVMRGEEVQLLGAIAAGLAPLTATLVQPGTHSKWVCAQDGSVVSIATSLTGELFALLRKYSLLSDIIAGVVVAGPSFRAGILDSKRGRLLGDLFRIRASALLNLDLSPDASSYASGLLIGSDVREQSLDIKKLVYVLAEPALGALYSLALEAYGARTIIIDSRRAFVAGITKIWSLANAS